MGDEETENDTEDEEDDLPPLGIIDQSASDDGTYRESDSDEEEGIGFRSERDSGIDGGYGDYNNKWSDFPSTGSRMDVDGDISANENFVYTSSVSPPPPLLSSPPTDRPNRFQGPSSTWRMLTYEERQNAQALEEIRARDLAAHLYNAYALRMRARDIARSATEGAHTNKHAKPEAFVPQKLWAAWPMPAKEVPRPDERLRRDVDDVWTLRMQPDLRPSAELEESLMAVMLKTAREKFEGRDWERPGHGNAVSEQKEGVDDDLYESTGDEREYKTDPDSEPDVPLQPVVQADDEKSRRQLRPLARNIITRVDDLLVGLHHTRKNDMKSLQEGFSSADTESEDSDTSRPNRRRTRSVTSRSRSRARKRPRRSEATSNDNKNRITELRRQKYEASKRFGLRDWCQVVGLASMMGLPTTAVMNTAQRCSNLFNEDMAFRTFHQGYVRQAVEDEGEPPVWVYSESETEDDESEHEPAPPTPHPSPPQRSKSRHKRPRRQHLRADSEPGITSTPTPAPATPATPEAARPASASDGQSLDATAHWPRGRSGKPILKGEHRKKDIVCPVNGCPRRHEGFSRTWNLTLHLRRAHPRYNLNGPGNSTKSPVNVSSDE